MMQQQLGAEVRECWRHGINHGWTRHFQLVDHHHDLPFRFIDSDFCWRQSLFCRTLICKHYRWITNVTQPGCLDA